VQQRVVVVVVVVDVKAEDDTDGVDGARRSFALLFGIMTSFCHTVILCCFFPKTKKERKKKGRRKHKTRTV